MKVEQAVFTSAASSGSQGYQLVARSTAVNDELAQQLCRWGPSHGCLLDEGPLAESLNFNYLSGDHLAISRSVLGGPEYSFRGGLQVVTRTLIFRSALLAGFDHNPWWVIRTALALGHLRLHCGGDGTMPSLSFPDTSRIGRPSAKPQLHESVVAEACQMLLLGRAVAIIGASDAHDILPQVMSRIPAGERIRVSFTTGLRPSVHRPYRMHLLSQVSQDLSIQLSKLGISQVLLSKQ